MHFGFTFLAGKCGNDGVIELVQRLATQAAVAAAGDLSDLLQGALVKLAPNGLSARVADELFDPSFVANFQIFALRRADAYSEDLDALFMRRIGRLERLAA